MAEMADGALNEKEEQYLAVASCFLYSKPDSTSLKSHYGELTPSKFNKGDKIVSRGTLNAGLFLVVSGTVEVVVTGNIFVLLSTPACSYMKTHGNETQRYVLDVALEGASFGEELALNPETPSALDYCAKTDCVVLRASSEVVKRAMDRDAIFRDRLVMLAASSGARRDASVQLLHSVAQIMRDSGLMVPPQADEGAETAPMAWPSKVEEVAAAEAAATKARKQEENNFLLGKNKVRRSSLSLAGAKPSGVEGITAAGVGSGRDRGKLYEPRQHERKRNRGMLSSFFNFGKEKDQKNKSVAKGGNPNPKEGEEEEDNSVTEDDLNTMSAMEDLSVVTDNIFAMKTNCIDSSQNKAIPAPVAAAPASSGSKSVFAKRRTSMSKAVVQSIGTGTKPATAVTSAGNVTEAGTSEN